MTEKIPMPGEFYRNKKGNLYQIITIAVYSETGERLVIYQALSGSFSIYARPLSQFFCENRKEKNQGCRQKYNFEKVLTDELIQGEGHIQKNTDKHDNKKYEIEVEQEMSVKNTKETIKDEIEAEIMCFFDTRSYREKMQILTSIKEYLEPVMVENIAVSLDIVLEEESLERQIDLIFLNLQAKAKYEDLRLR